MIMAKENGFSKEETKVGLSLAPTLIKASVIPHRSRGGLRKDCSRPWLLCNIWYVVVTLEDACPKIALVIPKAGSRRPEYE